MTRSRAVFLDRDGVLNSLVWRDGGWYSPRNVSDFHPVIGLKSALTSLKGMGYMCIVVTNQPDIARGYLTQSEVTAMNNELRKFGIEHFYVCPHDDADNCLCRKPRPGLMLRAAEDFSIDLKSSWLIGDRRIDIEAAEAAGVSSVLIEGARHLLPGEQADPNRLPTLRDAIQFIAQHAA